MTLQLFVQVVLNALMLGLTLVLISLGLSIIFGIMHIVNFAHGEVYMLGAYGSWLFMDRLTLPGPTLVRYFEALVITIILIAALGWILERGFFRAFRGKILQAFIVSLGFILIFQAGALAIFGVSQKSSSSPFPGVIHIGGAVLSTERVAVILFCIAFIVALNLFIQKAKAGQAMRAVAQDTDSASLQGININGISSLCMVIGCGLAGLAGCLLGPVFYVDPYIGATPVVKAFAAIILGGMGSIPGTILGGLVIGFVESFGSTYLGAELGVMLIFIILILVLLIRPRGLLGHG